MMARPVGHCAVAAPHAAVAVVHHVHILFLMINYITITLEIAFKVAASPFQYQIANSTL